MAARKISGFHEAEVGQLLHGALVPTVAWVSDEAPWLAFHPVPWADGQAEYVSQSEAGSWYTVTHLPTGAAVANVRTQATARRLIGLLAGVAGLESPQPNSPSLSAASAFVSSVQNECSAPSPGKISTFQLIQPTWATAAMAKQARVAEKLWAGRWHGETTTSLGSWETATGKYTDLALAAEWEAMMTSLGYGKTSSYGETSNTKPSCSTPNTSKPSSGDTSSTSPLPISPQEFARRYTVLGLLATRLVFGAEKMLVLHAYVREVQDGEWTADQLDRWRTMDERWRGLVAEAWLVWSGMALILARKPGYRARVERRLGFLGNDVEGYGAGFRRLVLDDPVIRELTPIRRRMNDVLSNVL